MKRIQISKEKKKLQLTFGSYKSFVMENVPKAKKSNLAAVKFLRFIEQLSRDHLKCFVFISFVSSSRTHLVSEMLKF
jgi:hypothetical protein